MPIKETTSIISPYLKTPIPYPTTTLKKQVTFVKAKFYDKFKLRVKRISEQNRKKPTHINDSYISLAGLFYVKKIYDTELKIRLDTAK